MGTQYLLRLIVLLACILPNAVQAFPNNSVLETFTGSDGTNPINSSWSDAEIRTNSAGCNIRSNAAAPNNTNYNGCYWNVQQFGPDSEAYATIANVGSTQNFQVFARIQSPSSNTSTNTTDAYGVETEDATDTINIIRIDNTIATVLTSIPSGGQITVGDKIGITAIGDQICAWWNDDGGGWVNMGCATDSTYSSAGYIGIGINGSATVGGLDDFGGGDIASSSQMRRRLLQ